MSPFISRKLDQSKLEILETRFNIYEDLSRQTIDRIDSAVNKISEANSKIASILAKHDEQIEQTIRSDQVLVSQMHEIRQENKEDHEKVIQRMDKLESKIEDLAKYRWIVLGVFTVVTFAITQSTFVTSVLTPDHVPANIQRPK